MAALELVFAANKLAQAEHSFDVHLLLLFVRRARQMSSKGKVFEVVSASFVPASSSSRLSSCADNQQLANSAQEAAHIHKQPAFLTAAAAAGGEGSQTIKQRE